MIGPIPGIPVNSFAQFIRSGHAADLLRHSASLCLLCTRRQNQPFWIVVSVPQPQDVCANQKITVAHRQRIVAIASDRMNDGNATATGLNCLMADVVRYIDGGANLASRCQSSLPLSVLNHDSTLHLSFPKMAATQIQIYALFGTRSLMGDQPAYES
jgi:hypothetical protein